jgi:hypothetical protein
VPSGVVLTPYTRVGGPAFGSNGAEWLMIEYGPGSISNPVRFYISVEMQLYENEVP